MMGGPRGGNGEKLLIHSRRRRSVDHHPAIIDLPDLEADFESVFLDITDKKVSLKEGVHMFVDKMWHHIVKVSNVVDEIKYPTGSRQSPAASCREIRKSYEENADGMYWIDPNQGGIGDAIEVFCNMTGGGATCMQPNIETAQVNTQFWRKDGEPQWFSEMDQGFEISYDDQVQAMAMRSSHASQTFIFSCDGSVAWFDHATRSTESALSLMGINEHLFDTKSIDGIKVLRDDCQTKQSGTTVFEIRSKASRLPIVDFLPKDYGQRHQKFGFKVGPVCFL